MFKYLSFTGQSGCYAELPLAVLAGASTFTIEFKLATTSTKSSSNNWQCAHICGREIGGNWQDDFGFFINAGKLGFWAEPVSRKGNDWTGVTTNTNAVVNDGLIHKVAVVSSNGAIDLYCDGALVAHTADVNAKITSTATILLAQDSDPNSYLQMDLYEARFWNVARTQEQIFADIDGTESGLQAWYLPSAGGLLDYSGNAYHATLYGNPAYTETDSLDVSFVADVKLKIKNAPLTWRYENAGDADDLILTAPILTNLPATKSKTGTAFYQTTRAKCFDLLATPEVWLKFDVYFDGSNRWRAYNGGANGITGICSYVNYSNGDFGMWQNSNLVTDILNICKTNTLQTVLLHMVSGSSAGVVEAWVDGNFIYRYTGDVNHGQDFADIYLQSDGSGTFFSNVIISNVEIGLDEDVSIGDVTINFTADLQRTLTNSIDFAADLQRTITTPIDFTADAQRNIFHGQNFTADLQRNVSNRADFTADIQRSVTTTVDFTVDLQRRIDIPETTFAVDVQRKLTHSVDFTADLQRSLAQRNEFSVDLQRKIFRGQNFTVDLRRNVSNRADFTADVQRTLSNIVDFTVDLQRVFYGKIDFTVDLQRVFYGKIDFTVDLQSRVYYQWLTRILPESSFLDPKIYASAEALDLEITKFHRAIREVLHLPRLDELNGTILDFLAEQFHVDNYDAINFSDEGKRNLIRQSIAWHRIKGTPAAVQMVLQDAFKDLRISEWYEYGGEPYYFRLWSRGYISTPERFKSFWNMFWDAKNVRSHLEKVTIDISPEEPIKIYTGAAKIVAGMKKIGLPRPRNQDLTVYAGVAKVTTGRKIFGLPRPHDQRVGIYAGAVVIRAGTIHYGTKNYPV